MARHKPWQSVKLTPETPGLSPIELLMLHTDPAYQPALPDELIAAEALAELLAKDRAKGIYAYMPRQDFLPWIEMHQAMDDGLHVAIDDYNQFVL